MLEGGISEERSDELIGCERSERKVEELFLIDMLLSLRSKMLSLCRKAVKCFCCHFDPAVALLLVQSHLHWGYTGVVCDDMTAGLGLPVGVNDGALTRGATSRRLLVL